MRRLVFGALALAVVLAAGGIAYLWSSLDGIVERRIERDGTRMLGSEVSVGRVDLDLRRGTGRIHDLRVANPDGFEGDEAFAFERIELTMQPGSVRERPIRIEDVEIDDATIWLEIDAQGRSNLDRLVRNTRAPKPPEPEDGPAGEPTRIAIARLDFLGGTLVLDPPGAGEPERLELLAFDKSQVGGARGATGGEIAKLLTQTLARQVAAVTAGREVERVIEREVGGRLGEAAGAVVEGLLRD
jgi:hypothetical protein